MSGFLTDWLETIRPRIRETTWVSYEMAANRITRQIEAMPLQALTPLQVESLYSTLLANGGAGGRPLAPKTVRNCHIVLRRALAAERLGLVSRNPAASARAVAAPRAEQGTWSSEEIQRFFEALAGERLSMAFVLLATTGMRRGEVLGLRWEDIDFDDRSLSIVQTLTTVRGERHIGPPKTGKSRRRVSVDKVTLDALKSHRKRKRVERIAAADVWSNEGDLVDSVTRHCVVCPHLLTFSMQTGMVNNMQVLNLGDAGSHGNDLLAKRSAEGLDVRLGQRARLIDWSGPGVHVETDDDVLQADAVVVAVPGPLTIGIGFWPALPPEKAVALSELTYGTAAKVIVQYAERETVSAAVGHGCFTDGTPPWIVEQSVHQPGDAVSVSSLLGGDAEPAVIDESVFAAFDASVTALTGTAVARTGQLSHSWTRDELARVIVRAPLGDQRTRVLPHVQRPLGGRVFFAGEHTDDRVGPGGLEGAARSELRVATELASA